MKNQYVFFTEEGYTIAPNNDTLDSYQILGFEAGETPSDAMSLLLDNNPWISGSGFDVSKVQYRIVLRAT